MAADARSEVRRLAGALRNDTPALADELVARQLRHVPGLREAGHELESLLRSSALASMRLAFAGMAGDLEPPAESPPPVRDLIRLMARLEFTVETVLRLYRIGHELAWERLLHEAEASLPDSGLRSEVLLTVSRYFFGFADAEAAHMAELHAAERENVRRGRERRSLTLVREILAGADPAASDAYAVLDYALAGWHVGLVASGNDPAGAVAAAARALGASQHLVVGLAPDISWGWVGRRRPFELDRLRRPPDGTALALGEPAEGIAGFRATHAQAREAHRVRDQTGAPLARYSEVGLLALALRDPDAARLFADEELHGIEGEDARSAALRDTLLAWFEAGHNGASAAAALGAHENTVANRLRTIEQRIGRPVASRHAELEVALRLRAILPRAG